MYRERCVDAAHSVSGCEACRAGGGDMEGCSVEGAVSTSLQVSPLVLVWTGGQLGHGVEACSGLGFK